MIDKIEPNARRALAGLTDGMTVMIGGFGGAGQPNHLINALIDCDVGELTVINNNAGNGDAGLAALLLAGRVRKIVCSFPRQVDSHVFDKLYREKRIELELVPQGNLAERIRAAGAGIGAFFFADRLWHRTHTRTRDTPDRWPGLCPGTSAARRLRVDLSARWRPLGQPYLPEDGAKLRTGDGNGCEDHRGASQERRGVGSIGS
jgi:hypothetical protein